MPAWIFEGLVILALIAVNGILAMSEIAIVSARKARLQQRASEGDAGAAMAFELAGQPGRFLSTVQIGITLVGILAGAFGGATIAEQLSDFFNRFPAIAPYSEAIGVTIVVLAITYLSLVVGELAPKQIAINNPERIAAFIAPLIDRLSRIAAPFVSLLSASTSLLLKVLRVRPGKEPQVTEEEIKILFEQGTESGIFQPIEEEMFEQVLLLGDRRIVSLMKPRTEVIYLEMNDSPKAVRMKVMASGESHLPVAMDTLDNVRGFITVRDLLDQCLSGKPLDLRAALKPAVYLPESMSPLSALMRLRETGSRAAFVIDEYGGVEGTVTMTDIVEEIIGELPEPGGLVDLDVVRREDGTWLLDGMVDIAEFKELFEIKELPGEREKVYQTVGGLVMAHLGRIPTVGDQFEWENLKIEVIDMDGKRVDKVLITPPD